MDWGQEIGSGLMKKQVDRWKPRRRGLIYCSPACGCGCTRADYELASKNSIALASRMGDGWVAVVWENMGWQWSVGKGVAAIHPHGKKHYTVFFNSKTQVVKTAETPEKALEMAVVEAEDIARDLYRDCALVRK